LLDRRSISRADIFDRRSDDRHKPIEDPRAMHERLSAMDGSFLRLETGGAHMHVAWSATLKVDPECEPPTVDRLRASVAARLDRAPRFRRRLAFPTAGIGEPSWVDDPHFDISRHVLALGGSHAELDDRRFAHLCDRALSVPLARDQPLWEIRLAPRLSGDRVGLMAKLHHALVDGKSALEVALLLFDLEPDAPASQLAPWSPERGPGAARLAADAVGSGVEESLRAVRGAARLATEPRSAARLGGTLRRAALAAGEDLLRPAPSSSLNTRIGSRRTLVRHAVPREDLKAIKRAAGVTLNDVCLATAAGALRQLSLERGERPRPLKTMVPVNVRAAGERAELGNRISMVFVDLPLDVPSAAARLGLVHRATSAFKRSGRPAGAETVFSALGLLPPQLRGVAARALAAPRTYNLTISNVPGPDFPLYVLGARLLECYPVVPIASGHALSIGIFTYCSHVHFGFYADPHAFPDVRSLPAAMDAALADLSSAFGRGPRRRHGARPRTSRRTGRAAGRPSPAPALGAAY
jgi:WS/DGAT/MGAT family acyltransferase